jgi:pSer/pThr/pTyr-binding forkhead associated (FHA) protein
MDRPQTRFRLRLFAQEFDLHAGATRIGRSPACEVTIDDPAISREHALILVEGDAAVLRDLGSRNGVRINGRRVSGDVPLSRGDRIRIGNQDLVFGCTGTPSQEIKVRDVMETGELDSLTPLESPRRTSWWLEIQSQLLEDAVRAGEARQADGILRGMEEGMHERLAGGEPYERAVLERALCAALDLAVLQNESRWVELVFDMLRDFRVVPGGSLAAKIESLPSALVDVRRSHRRVLRADEDVSQVS